MKAAGAAEEVVDGAVAYVRQVAVDRGDEEFVAVGVSSGPRGLSFHAYERKYRGLRVVGGDFVVVADASGAVLGSPLAGQGAISVGTVPVVSAERAARVARAELAGVDAVGAPELVVFSPEGEQTLAYEVVVRGRSVKGTPSMLHVIVDARFGAVLAEWDEVLAGIGHGHYYDDVTIDTTRTSSGYSMSDRTRSGMFCGVQGNGAVSGPDDVWGNRSGTDLETACSDAYYAAQQEWNMLRDWLGRDGFDGNGRAFPIFVGLNQVNAYWNGHTVNIGHSKDNQRQLSVLDIVAHEHGHAVFQFTPGGFDGYVETYALNEASGDIFGALTEHYANHPDDPPDYVYAEEADALGRGPERVMYDPSAGPRDEPNCWSTAIPSTEVHDAAGPANHWFYLIAEGSHPGGGKPDSPICAGGPASVDGMGIRNAGRVWMTALMQKTSFWEYADARVATMNAVTQLFPGDCAKFDTVKGAWDAVSVPRQSSEPGRPDCGDPIDDFAVAVTPTSAEVDAGAAVSAQISTTIVTGDPQTIALAASGLPTGVTASFTPASVTSGETSTMDIATTASTPAGTYRITITGTGTAGSRTAVFTLTVRDEQPDGCTGFETTRTGTLGSGGSVYQPDGRYFHTTVPGAHRACLDGPDSANFDLYLQRWSGSSWATVARGVTSAADEELSYSGTAGYYRYRIHAYSGSGDYTLGYDSP
ncbi:zinc metalloprotease [Actinokineospora fastidiosa]|uniref:Zinc metalloprotease n=1 Tax=Actinokineospora fastidiosa TaxID=1816 RepID=A0A918GS44_9PSEU|nr:zinc metalloprotease [Actinokineospora fastidiosa]